MLVNSSSPLTEAKTVAQTAEVSACPRAPGTPSPEGTVGLWTPRAGGVSPGRAAGAVGREMCALSGTSLLGLVHGVVLLPVPCFVLTQDPWPWTSFFQGLCGSSVPGL